MLAHISEVGVGPPQAFQVRDSVGVVAALLLDAPAVVDPADVEPPEAAPLDVDPVDVDPVDVDPLDVEPLDVEPLDVEPLDVEPLLPALPDLPLFDLLDCAAAGEAVATARPVSVATRRRRSGRMTERETGAHGCTPRASESRPFRHES
jgi:hypothetical protein